MNSGSKRDQFSFTDLWLRSPSVRSPLARTLNAGHTALSKIKKALREPHRVLQYSMLRSFQFIDQYVNYGTNVFSEEWDLLIILDACRYDLFVEFAPRHSVYELLDSVEKTYSIASQTPVWLERTFNGADGSVLSKTVYVSGMGYIENIDKSKLRAVVPIWRLAHDQEAGVLRPEAITNEAVRQFRQENAGRYVVHYVQPHAPFLHCAGKYDSIADSSGQSQNVWQGLHKGRFDENEVWSDYGQNLLLVLDEVEKLIRNFDGEVAITADHGNAFGEFGQYGHPTNTAAPSIRRVPWATASGLGKNEYELVDRKDVRPDVDEQNRGVDLEQHLRDLGYRT